MFAHFEFPRVPLPQLKASRRRHGGGVKLLEEILQKVYRLPIHRSWAL